MRNWSLREAIYETPTRLAGCPRCGEVFPCPDGPWRGPWAIGLLHVENVTPHLTSDMTALESVGITTVGELLDVAPSQVLRNTEIPSERLSFYRLRSRSYVDVESHIAWLDLQKLVSSEFRKITKGLALRLQQFREYRDSPIEVIITMGDNLNFEELLSLSPERRMRRRQQHAEESQRDLIAQLAAQPSGDQDGYLQVWLSNQLVASLTIGQIAIVAAMNSVASISLALTVRSCIDQAVTRISANTTQSTRTGNDQVVALLDSGINSAHPYLPSSQIKHQKHYVGSNTDDEFGHGTHLAGVIAGKHSLYKGIAPDATIWSYRVLDQQGKSAGTTSLLTAVQDLVSDAIALSPTQPVIANCSFAVPLSSFASEKDYEDFCDPFDNATSDLVVVSAAGNEGPDPATITAPGGGFRVITVGASVSRPGASLNFVSPYSSRGPATNQRDKPDVVAPGGFRNPKGEANKEVSMVSTRLASGTLDSLTSNDKPWQVDAEHFGLSGTSQATAVVSAACALILEELTLRNRSVTHAEVANALRKSAQTLGFTTYEQGQGLIDVDEAIAKI